MSKKLTSISNNRIPVIVQDTLPIQTLSIEKAKRLLSHVTMMADSLNSYKSRIQSYCNSASNIISEVRQDNSEEMKELLDQHYRIFGGTLHRIFLEEIGKVKSNIEELEKILDEKKKGRPRTSSEPAA